MGRILILARFFPDRGSIQSLQSLIRVCHLNIMKRAVEYTAMDDNGVPLKKHDDYPDARIVRIRDEIVVEQAITALHSSIATLHNDLDKRLQ
jgi:hypothetical protein